MGNVATLKKLKIALKKKNIILIEDAAQAHGAYDYSYGKKKSRAGSIGDLGCFSFYPGKNLGAYGDGGAVTTNSKKLRDNLLKLRNLGGVKKYEHKVVGYNSRLDTIQAAILDNKLKKLNLNNRKRVINANYYKKNIKNKNIKVLNLSKGCVYHQFVVLTKKIYVLMKELKKEKIQFGRYYPNPIHKLEATKKIFKNQKYKNAEYFSKYGIGLPIDPNITKKEILKICNIANKI